MSARRSISRAFITSTSTLHMTRKSTWLSLEQRNWVKLTFMSTPREIQSSLFTWSSNVQAPVSQIKNLKYEHVIYYQLISEL